MIHTTGMMAANTETGSVLLDTYSNYDGVTDAVTKGGTAIGANANEFTMSYWWRPTSDTGTVGELFFSWLSDEILGSGEVQCQLQTKYSAPDWGLIWQGLAADPGPPVSKQLIRTTNFNIVLNQWNHILISIDSGAQTYQIYINDSDEALTLTTDISFGSYLNNSPTADWAFGRFIGVALFYAGGDYSQFWMKFGTAIDLDTVSNRRDFIDASGDPVELGASGQLPTGASAELFAPNGDLRTNDGSAANWVIAGGDTAPTNFP